MSELDRRTFLRLGLGLGLASLIPVELPDLLADGGQIVDQNREIGAVVPLHLDYLGTVRLAHAAPVHYHVYQTTHALTNQEHGALYVLAAGTAAVAPRTLASALHPAIRGALTLHIEPFAADDPRYQRQLPDGQLLQHGATLGALHTLFGGDRGVLVDPARGQAHPIDLTPWAQAHPQHTYLNIAFYFRPL